MNLHEQMAADLGNVFFNLGEFACEHVINGKTLACIVDDEQAQAGTRSVDDLANVSGAGLVQCDRVVLCQAADLVSLSPSGGQPLPGEKITMDGSYWYVADSGVAETEGLLSLPLVRAF